ncbi:MAG TPA: hypothetical protein VME17_16950 [Bryobacteraceae bacterium]|nr:hypothetical protein [Bryobacteraceae bacterium]
MPDDTYIYRFMRPVTLLLNQKGRYRLVQVPEGSIINARDPKPDVNGMIEGTYRGTPILMFSIDLEDRAELILRHSAQSFKPQLQQRTA